MRSLLRRLWPQKVRLRLTLLYAGLFLAAGSALLWLTYGLVAASLATRPAVSGARPGISERLDPNQRAKLAVACRQPNQDPGTILRCKEAFTAGGEDTRQQALHSLLLYSLLGLGVMTLASGGTGWLISGRVLRPVVTITETARRASEQHLGERLGLTGARDELKELADTFDDMLDRLDRAFGMQRRFVANASHELRTPLTAMRTAIDVTLAKPGRTVAQLDAMALRVRRSADAAEALIGALLTLAISDQGPAASEFLDLSALAEDALELAGPRIGRLGLKVTTNLEPAETTGDPQLLERMVWNLIDNVVKHNHPGGWIELRTGYYGGSAVLRVANSGAVIPADDLPTLTEPFRRLAGRAGSQDGAGLGLSIAHSVCTAHGTTLEVRGQPDGGLDIRVVLPHPAD